MTTLNGLTRRHADALTARERMHLRAAAIIRGDDPEAATGQPPEGWGAAGETLSRAALLGLADALATIYGRRLADAWHLAAVLAEGVAAMAEDAAEAATAHDDGDGRGARADGTRERAATVRAMAETVAREVDAMRGDAAARWAGFDAWGREAYGADPWAIITRAELAHLGDLADAGDPRTLPAAEAVAETWGAIASTLTALVAELEPDPEAVELARATFAASEAYNVQPA